MLVILILLMALRYGKPFTCKYGLSKRKEIQSYTPDEWNVYKDTILRLQDVKSSDGSAYSEWDRLTKMHMDQGHKFHMTRLFLHWHRTYTAAFEQALRSINPNVTLPYWVIFGWSKADIVILFRTFLLIGRMQKSHLYSENLWA